MHAIRFEESLQRAPEMIQKFRKKYSNHSHNALLPSVVLSSHLGRKFAKRQKV
jgi:hypothetical protein